MKTIELKSRKFLRKMFNGVSLTAVAFIFQACYGPGPDMYCDFKLTGTVTSKITNLPIKGIKVSVNDGLNFRITDEHGKFDFYASVPECNSQNSVDVHFYDIDGAANGHFANKTMVVKPAKKDEIKIDVALDEIE